jgi:glycosyltransferase involved in cell wall biosynthesis
MGFTLLESQACGTPVICTDAGAMSEFVINERSGMVVDQNSPTALSSALERVVNASPTDFSNMLTAAATYAAQFRWQRVVEQHLLAYHRTYSTA